VQFNFDAPVAYLSLGLNLTLAEAKRQLLKSVEYLEAHWADLHEEAERQEHEFGRKYEPDLLCDDVPF
jgi:hypothetical protein